MGNALEALFGEGMGTPEVAEVRRRISAEAEECFRAAGLETMSQEKYAELRPDGLDAGAKTERDLTKPVGPLNKPGNSTVQSIMRGLDAETDHLNGEIVLLGRLAGVATPVNAAVQRAMAGLAARKEGAVGSVRPKELLAAAASL